MKASQRLPVIVNQVFLAGDGFVGYRCPNCLYVATGRSMEAVEAAYWVHEALVHLQADPDVSDTGITD